MKTNLKLITICYLLSAMCFPTFAQSTTFTYQGRLNDGANPAGGRYDLTFALFTVSSGAGQVGNTITNSAIALSNGLFTVLLDFGSQFPGADRFLEIGIRTNGVASFTTLTPRQKLSPSPYAITAGNVVSGGIAAGTYSNAIVFNNSANSFVGSVSGNGAGMTNVNAVTLGGFSSASFWKTNGNVGANPTNGVFLGTTDNLPLEFRVNTLRAVKIEPGTSGTVSMITGSPGNQLKDTLGGTISGGGSTNSPNRLLSADFSAIGGGLDNMITNARAAVIAGGEGHVNFDQWRSFIGSGSGNQMGGTDRATSGASGPNSNNSIIGGFLNFIRQNSRSCVIGGGELNSIGTTGFAFSATVPGGYDNAVNGDYSYAAGFRAKANHDSTFVWADSQNADFASTGSNQFLIRASGGVGIGTASPTREIEVQHAGDTEIGIKSADAGAHLWTLQSSAVDGGGNDASFQIIDRTLNSARLFIGTNGFVGIGTTSPTNRLHVNGGLTCTALTQTSDRNAKENFAPISSREILDKVASLPITTWNFKELHDGRHMGPMAQDFYAAFRLGSGDTTITSVDPDGVALAAIQGLNQKLEETRAELKRSGVEITELKRQNESLEKRLEALEQSIHRHD